MSEKHDMIDLKLPWTTTGGLKTVGWGIRDEWVVRDADEMPVCACFHPSHMPRIVACVNACRDVPTKALEAGWLAKIVWGTLRQERALADQGLSVYTENLLRHLRDVADEAHALDVECEMNS